MEKLQKYTLGILMVFLLLLSGFLSTTVFAEEGNTWNPAANSYKISSIQDLKAFRESINDKTTYEGKTITLEKDLIVGEVGTIGKVSSTGYFQGTFDGKGHKIENFNDPNSGLFNIIGEKGIVSNVSLDMNVQEAIGFEVTSECNMYGGIANVNTGMISQCQVSGNLTASLTLINRQIDLGGISGALVLYDENFKKVIPEQNHYVHIANCVVSAEITVPNAIEWGLAFGFTSNMVEKSSIHSSYFTGRVSAAYEAQPLARPGLRDSIYNSDNFVGTAKGGIPKTTAEMKQKQTYTAEGWDFEKIWTIEDGVGYPTLRSDLPVGGFMDREEKIVDIEIHINDKAVKEDGTIVDIALDGTQTPSNSKATLIYTIRGVDGSIDENFIKENEVAVDDYGNKPIVKFPNQLGENIDLSGQLLFAKPDKNGDYSSLRVLGNQDCTDQYTFKINNITWNNPRFYDLAADKPFEGDVSIYLANGDKASMMVMEKYPLIIKDDNTSSNIQAAWVAFSDARAGYANKEKFDGDAYFAAIKKQLEAKDANFDQLEITDWEKLALAVTSLGYDARDLQYKDKNLIEIITNKEAVMKSGQHMAVVTCLLALDSYNYAIPEGDQYVTREELKERLVEISAAVDPTNLKGDIDHTAMYSQGLAPYYHKGDAKLDAAVDNVIKFMSNAQAYSGGYGAQGDPNNPWSCSQVLITLGVFDVNPLLIGEDNLFVKSGKTLYDALFTKFDFENGTYSFGGRGGLDAAYDNHQAVRGLNSVKRSLTEGATSFFDCSDVTNSTILVNNEIGKLPAVEAITKDNLEQVQIALVAVDTKLADLNETQKNSMDMSKYNAVKEKLGSFDVIAGDANGDGVVTLEDATAIQKYLANVEGVEINEIASDVSHTGGIDLEDATLIQKYLAHVSGVELTLK